MAKRNISKEKILSEKQAKIAKMKFYDDKVLAQLKDEKLVGVMGNPLFKETLGNSYMFLYNGRPVAIEFDGKVHKYPETIANLLISKLAQTSLVNTRVDINEEI